MDDRTVAGALAGFVASLFQESYAQILKLINLTDRSYGDFALSLVTSTKADTVLEILVGILSNIGIGLFFGVVFAFLLKVITPRYLLLKGFFYGWILWVFLNGFGATARLPEFVGLEPNHSLVALSGSILWGLVNAYILLQIDKKTSLL